MKIQLFFSLLKVSIKKKKKETVMGETVKNYLLLLTNIHMMSFIFWVMFIIISYINAGLLLCMLLAH